MHYLLCTDALKCVSLFVGLFKESHSCECEKIDEGKRLSGSVSGQGWRFREREWMDFCGHQGGERTVLSVHLCVVVYGGRDGIRIPQPQVRRQTGEQLLWGKVSCSLSRFPPFSSPPLAFWSSQPLRSRCKCRFLSDDPHTVFHHLTVLSYCNALCRRHCLVFPD